MPPRIPSESIGIHRIDRLILIDSGGATMEFGSWFGDNIRARMRPEDIEAERYWTDAAAHGVSADKVALEVARAATPRTSSTVAKGWRLPPP